LSELGSAAYLIMTIVGPAILLVVLAGILSRPNGNRAARRRTARATRELYREEERRRRDGTDKC
jgi:hypothetical protein